MEMIPALVRRCCRSPLYQQSKNVGFFCWYVVELVTSKMQREGRSAGSKALAVATVFASLWIAVELTLGPLVGRLSLGPFSLHGAVNRVLGWFLMSVMTWFTGGFGSITLMAGAAALGTRMFRPLSLESIVVGIGYVLGGFVFDILCSVVLRRGSSTSMLYGMGVAVASAVTASTPYLIWNLTTVGTQAFALLLPVYALGVVKEVILSSIGTMLGLKVKVGPAVRALLTCGKQG